MRSLILRLGRAYRNRQPQAYPLAGSRPGLETLEDRCVPSAAANQHFVENLYQTLLGRPAPALSTFNPQLSTVSTIPWRLLHRAMPKHTILVWLGDFPARPAPDGWPVFQRRYNTMGFRVDDPWERALPAGQTFAAYDPLAGRLVTLDGSASQRSAHAQWRAAREAAWSALFPDRRSRLVVTTEEDRFDALVKFFRARMAAR